MLSAYSSPESPMFINLSCPACSRAIKVRDEMAGKKARCPSCKHVFPVAFAAQAIVSVPPAAIPVAAPPVALLAAGEPPQPYASPSASIALPPYRPPGPSGAAVLPWVLFAATLAVLIGVLGLLSIGHLSGGDTARGNALILILLWICQLILVPMVGGFFLWLGCKLTRILAPYLRCWLAYLAAYAVASCICLPLCFLLPRASGIPSTMAWLLILAVAIGVHGVVVPFLLRAGFIRSLLAQLFAIFMTASLALLLAIPLVLHLRSRAYEVMDTVNLREIGHAFRHYEQEHHHLPPHAIYDKDKKKALLSWRVMLLPYIEQEPLYREFHLDEPWDSEHNLKLLPRMPKIYATAAKGPDQTATHFQVFTSEFPHKLGILTPFPRSPLPRVQLSHVFDGPSQTLGVAEAANAVPWTKPDDLKFTLDGPIPPLGAHPGRGTLWALYLDGSVRRISVKAPALMLTRLIRHNDGENVNFDLIEP